MPTRRQLLPAAMSCRIGRRRLVLAFAAAMPLGSFAQPQRPRIGILSPRSLEESVLSPHVVHRLAELGYRDRQAMTLHYKSADGRADHFPALGRQLVTAKCDLVFALGPQQAATAFRDLQSGIPLVFYAVDFDPVRAGLIKNLTRPDGPVTGVYVPQDALVAKRFELLREVVPSARRFLVLADVFTPHQLAAARTVASKSGFQLTEVEFARPPYDLESAFQAGRNANVEGVMTLTSPTLFQQAESMATLAQKHRLPSIGTGAFADRGILLGYGQHLTKGARRTAEIGVRILKGTKPELIPVEQDDEFELAINAATARQLSIRIPESLRARAVRIVG